MKKISEIISSVCLLVTFFIHNSYLKFCSIPLLKSLPLFSFLFICIGAAKEVKDIQNKKHFLALSRVKDQALRQKKKISKQKIFEGHFPHASSLLA